MFEYPAIELILIGFAFGAVFALLFAFLTKPKLVLLLLLASRPTLQIFAHNTLRVPGTSVYMNPVGFLNILLIACGTVYILNNRVAIFKLPVSIPYLVFLCAVGVSILISPRRMSGIADLFRLASTFIFYVLLVESIDNRKDIERLVLAILISWIVPNFVGIYEMFALTGHWDAVREIHRINATFQYPNEYSDFLLVYSVISMVLLIYFKSWKIKAVLSFMVGMMLVSLYYTYTRAATLGLFIAAIPICILRQKKWLVFLALVLIFYVLYSSEMGRYGEITTGKGGSTAKIRLLAWRDGISAFLSSPIFGHGFASFIYISEGGSVGWRMGAHNDYIRILVETGLFGLIAFLCTLAFLLRDGIRTFRQAHDIYYQYLALGSISTIIGLSVTAFFAHVFVSPGIQWYSWSLAGISYKALHIDRLDLTDVSRASVSNLG